MAARECPGGRNGEGGSEEGCATVKPNSLRVSRLRSLPPGKHGDGRGLRQHERPGDGAQRIRRFTPFGRIREMGLAWPRDVGLAEAARDHSTCGHALAAGNGPGPVARRPRAVDSLPPSWVSARGHRKAAWAPGKRGLLQPSESRCNPADHVQSGGVGRMGAQEPVAGIRKPLEEAGAAQRVVSGARGQHRAQRVGLELELL